MNAGCGVTVRAVVAYDGTDFHGMQFLPGLRTVAGELEKAFAKLLAHEVKITSAGRTDSGVHASGQVVSFKTQTAFPFDRFAIAANAELPRDVSVREAHACNDNFSARFSAVERTYVYAVHCSPLRSALHARFAHHMWKQLDIEAFNEGAAALIGEHDFRSFCGRLPQTGPTIRSVRTLRAQISGDMLRIEICADGFLHRMVRTIVGTLLECAMRRREPRTVPAILAARDRAAAGLTAPANGLHLAGVRYGDGFDSFREPPVTCSG